MDGVAYLNTGMKHADNLVVSLMSLKEHWDGPICIWTASGDLDSDGNKIAKACRDDGRLGDIRIVPFDFYGMPGRAKKNNNYLAKPYCMRHCSPFDRTVFLDADTCVVGDFSEMFPSPEEIRVTQFENWTANSSKMRGRIERRRRDASLQP